MFSSKIRYHATRTLRHSRKIDIFIWSKNVWIFVSKYWLGGCCKFCQAFGCCAPQALVEIFIFSIFCSQSCTITQICYFFATFQLLSSKMLKMTILTSIWGAHHPNAGQNIQQVGVLCSKKTRKKWLVLSFR